MSCSTPSTFANTLCCTAKGAVREIWSENTDFVPLRYTTKLQQVETVVNLYLVPHSTMPWMLSIRLYEVHQSLCIFVTRLPTNAQVCESIRVDVIDLRPRHDSTVSRTPTFLPDYCCGHILREEMLWPYGRDYEPL